MNTKTTLAVSLLLIVLFFGAIFWFSRDGAVSVSVTADDWARGAVAPAAELIEYGDFQCPACATYEPLVQQAQAEFKDTLRFAYRHFPLTQIHQNALLAAKASEAAGAQGKFWEMHDLLFEKQEEWSESSAMRTLVTAYAKALKLDLARFEAELDSEKIEEKIQAHYAEGIRLKVRGTPTFFLNGAKIANPRNYDELRRAIEDAMENRSLSKVQE